MRHRTTLLMLTTAAIVSACSGQTPTPSPSLEPSRAPSQAASAEPSPIATPTPSPEPSGTVHLSPGANSPLENAVFYALRPAADGFWLIGSESYEKPFLVKGSADGTTWKRLDIGSMAANLADVAEGQQGTVLVQVVSDTDTGDQSTTLWHSSDGTTFVPIHAQADLDKAGVERVFAGPSGFAAVGQIIDRSLESTSMIWTSPDGRSWSSAKTPAEVTIDHVVVLDDGYIAFETGAHGSVPAEYVSRDGLGWARDTADAKGPFGVADTSLSTPVAVGGTLATVRSDGTVWSGRIGAGANGPAVEWHRLAQVEAEQAFADTQVVSAASSSSGATLLGFDLITLEPTVWRSTDGISWQRESVDPTTFGGGVAMLVARSGDVDATLGFEVNADGDIVRRPWASRDRKWAIADGDVLGAMPAVASGPCPDSPPTDPDKLAAISPELRPACFGHQALHLTGFVGSCECGGTSTVIGRPDWLANDLDLAPLYIRGTRPSDDDPGASMPVWLAPSAGLPAPPYGSAVSITGHFDDPDSTLCRLIPMPGPPNDLTPKEAAIAQCRQHFVAASIRRR